MRKNWKLAVLPLVLLPTLVGGFLLQGRHSGNGESLFSEVLARVAQDGVESPPVDELYERAARGLVGNLGDPYADLFSPEQLADFQRQALGNAYGGVGMQIENQQGSVTVTKVFPNTPAEGGGVQPGDRIVEVSGHVVKGWKLKEVSDSLIGQPGTPVDVAFDRAGVAAPIRTRFTRAVIHVPAVPFAIVLDDGIGYVPLQRFNDTSAKEVADAIVRLSHEGARAYVLDLRGDPGGSLDQALQIADLFLAPGQELASVRYRNRDPDVYRAQRQPLVPDAPLVVLADGFTASASEIVTGSLQDHDRGLVVGSTTFGKGLVQTVYPLQQGWALKLTTGKWYTPAGRSIQRESRGLHTEDPDATESQAEADTATGPRPEFRSDEGRVVFGGGGIVPDVAVQPDTLTTNEQAFMTAVGPHSQEAYVALYDMALDLKGRVKPGFKVPPAWRTDFMHRLREKGVDLPQPTYDEAADLVDRMIEQRVATLAFGDSAAFRLNAPFDSQLQTAIRYLKEGKTQKQLFSLAAKQEE